MFDLGLPDASGSLIQILSYCAIKIVGDLALKSACPASARPWVLSWGREAVCYYLNEFTCGSHAFYNRNLMRDLMRDL